jgi:hypothetical protein
MSKNSKAVQKWQAKMLAEGWVHVHLFMPKEIKEKVLAEKKKLLLFHRVKQLK